MTLGEKSSSVDRSGETMFEEYDFGRTEEKAWNRRFVIAKGQDDLVD